MQICDLAVTAMQQKEGSSSGSVDIDQHHAESIHARFHLQIIVHYSLYYMQASRAHLLHQSRLSYVGTAGSVQCSTGGPPIHGALQQPHLKRTLPFP